MVFGSSGWGGFSIPVIWLASLMMLQLCFDALLGQGYYAAHTWTQLAGSALAGLVLWIYGNRLNPATESIDTKEGQRTVLAKQLNRHTLLSIPAQHWGWILAVVGGLIAITG